MGDGDFAVVPSSLADGADAHCFLPSYSVCESVPQLSIHSLSDTLTLVADSSGWKETCSCHEIEPLLCDCLQSGVDSVHAALFDHRLYISVLKDNSLVFVNRFTSECDEDTLYHILAVFKATGLDRMRQTLFLRGEMNRDFLKKYFDRCV